VLAVLQVLKRHHTKDLARQSAGPGQRKSGLLSTVLEDREDHGVPFHEKFLRAVLGKQLIDRLEEIPAEVGGGIETF